MPLSSDGPLVNLELAWNSADIWTGRQTGQPIPQPVNVHGLVDTGAEITCLDSLAVRQLGAPVAGVIRVNVPALGGPSFVFKYDLLLRIVHPSGTPAEDLMIPKLAVLDLDLGPVGYQALIGRDVLEQCDFIYRGRAGEFELSY